MVAEGEGLTVEFKEKYTPKIDRDIVAFANTKGGLILLGVSDSGEVVGEKLTNRLKAEIHSIARNCEPDIPLGKIIQVGNIVAIEVLVGDEKPYSCAAGYYRRLDAVSQKMTRKEIQHLFQGMPSIPFEDKIHPNVTWKDISKQKIEAFFDEAQIDYRKINPPNVLNSLNLSANNKVKNAGVMFFAKDPRRAILQCQMTLLAFKGSDRTHIYDRKDVQDDLLTQYKEAIIFLEKHLNVRSEIEGVNRRDIYEIPFKALREAIANAIIHRDYSVRGTSIMVEVHENKVVISNPGGFPSEMDKSKLGKASVRRNEVIADIFARMHKVERIGSGFQRIRESLNEAKLPFPSIESDSFFIITFQRPPYSLKMKDSGLGEKLGVKLGINESKIIDLLKIDPHTTNIELAKKLNLSTTTIDNNIARLKNKNFLKRLGSRKSGHWEIVFLPTQKLGEKLGVKREKNSDDKPDANEVKIIEILQTNPHTSIHELAEKLNISTTTVENNLSRLKNKGILKRIGPDKGGHWEVGV